MIVIKLIYRLLGALNILSARGWILLLITLPTMVFIAHDKHDVIASSFTLCAMSVLCMFLLILTVSKYYLKRDFSCRVFFPINNLFSNTHITYSLAVKGVKLPSLFKVKLIPEFFPHKVSNNSFLLSGKKEERTFSHSLRFPTRGNWLLKSIKCEFRDSLGLTRSSWRVQIGQRARVLPPPYSYQALEVQQGSVNSGDLFHDFQERTGDYYDMKRYAPSDGTARIIWSIYAKSGELVVREREQAVVPEGETAVFLIAREEDEEAASACRSYLKQLEDEGAKFLFSSDGFSELEASGLNTLESSILGADELMIETTFLKSAGLGEDLPVYLSKLKTLTRAVSRVVIFMAKDNAESVLNRVRVSAVQTPLSLALVGGSSFNGSGLISNLQSDINLLVCERVM